jgi:hypothetical protein
MKFSEIEQDRWQELRPYVDTALLPLSGLAGTETPFEATAALERLRDALDPLEQSYRGRVVTYPALHYAASDESLASLADELCARLKASGFRYCVVVTGDPRLHSLRVPNASAVLGPRPESNDAPSELYRSLAKRTIEELWHG